MLKKQGILRTLLSVVLLGTCSLTYGYIRDGQIFDVQVPSSYSGGTRANEGFFFGFTGLYWCLPSQDDATIGNENIHTQAVFGVPYSEMGITETKLQGNTFNTNVLEDKWEMGQKYEFGFMNGHRGWSVSIFNVGNNQSTIRDGVQIAFDDQPTGNDNGFLQGYVQTQQALNPPARERLGVQFDRAGIFNSIDMWSVDFNLIGRMHPTHCGIFEWGFGVRYVRWDENLGFQSLDRTNDADEIVTIASVLDYSNWSTDAVNDMVGPQIGMRWYRTQDRFTLEVNAKFTAAYNYQQVRQSGWIASMAGGQRNGDDYYYYAPDIPVGGMAVTERKKTYDEFTPIVELGIQANILLTNKVAFTMGWTGMYMNGVARPGSMVDYTFGPEGIMNLYDGNNRQDVFINGVNFGLTINR